MPTVLREGRLRVAIRLSPREHGPPHVRVFAQDSEVVIDLAAPGVPQRIRRIGGMRLSDVTDAFSLVEDRTEYLLTCWWRLHG